MEVEQVREIIYSALERLQSPDCDIELHSIGNRVYMIAGNDEFEIVIKTMRPKGSQRLAIKLD